MEEVPTNNQVNNEYPKHVTFNNEGIPSFKSTKKNSLNWRIFHSTNYLIGGVFFVFGSLCYYPIANNYVSGDILGAWFFTIGSLAFLIADLVEWNHYRFGCVGGPKSDSSSFLKRAAMGINFFCSAIGSFIYVLGSIYFIPSMNNLLLGENLFIEGSLVIFFSQSVKCYRSSVTNVKNPLNNGFSFDNIKQDTVGFCVDLFAGLGGLFYSIGTYLFKLVVTEEDLIVAVHVFVLGGLSFTISGIFILIRYFGKENEKEEDYDKI